MGIIVLYISEIIMGFDLLINSLLFVVVCCGMVFSGVYDLDQFFYCYCYFVNMLFFLNIEVYLKEVKRVEF